MKHNFRDIVPKPDDPRVAGICDRVAVLVNEKEVKTFEVTAPKDKPATNEVKFELPKGEHRIHDRARWERKLTAIDAHTFAASPWHATRLQP